MRHSPDIARFARDLSGLLRLGYTLEEAVTKAGDCQSTEVAGLAQSVTAGLQKGQTLAQAMEPQAAAHPLFYRLVSGAEEGEILEEGLLRSAEILEELADRRLQTYLTILYPSVVFTVVYSGAFFLLSFGGNLFKNLFMSMNIRLPLLTKIFLVLSDFLSSPIGIVLTLLPLLVLWCVVLGKTPMGAWLYKVPIYGRWLRHQESIMFLSTMGQLVEQGTPLTEACRVAATVCAPPVRSRFTGVADRLDQGDSLSGALERSRVIPEIAVWALIQRENTESLRLREIARLLQRELDCATHTGSLVFEPLLFLMLLFGIGFFMVSIFLPLYQLIGNLG